MTLEDMEDAMSERVLIWPQRVEAHRAQKIVLDNVEETKEFDAVRHSVQRNDSEAPKSQKVENYKYVEQNTCQDSALYMEKVESVENQTTSRQCVGQHIGSSQTRKAEN